MTFAQHRQCLGSPKQNRRLLEVMLVCTILLGKLLGQGFHVLQVFFAAATWMAEASAADLTRAASMVLKNSRNSDVGAAELGAGGATPGGGRAGGMAAGRLDRAC